MSILDRIEAITRRNFEDMAKIEVVIKPKEEPKPRIERPDKEVTVTDLSGEPHTFNIRSMEHSFYVTNGSSRYFLDIPERIEIDKETFNNVMYLATGEKFYRVKAKPALQKDSFLTKLKKLFKR